MKRLAAAASAAFLLLVAQAQPTQQWSLTVKSSSAEVFPGRRYETEDLCKAAAKAQLPDTFTCSATINVADDIVVLPPVMKVGVWVDPRKIAAPGIGSGTDDLVASAIPPLSPDGTGDFRTECTFSHMNFDDPIVFPGMPMRSHLHVYAGNTLAAGGSTAESLASTGNSTCRGGTINRSAYWQPAIIDTLDGTPQVPYRIKTYYKSGYNLVPRDPSVIQPMPAGLRMIAGSSAATAPGSQWASVGFRCIDPKTNNGPPMAFVVMPAMCAVGSTLWAIAVFPQCWDGVNLDSPDHKSHMHYVVAGKCPSTHPVPIPEITMQYLYLVTDAGAYARWRLASDNYDVTKPPGYSMHADWFNGWQPSIEQAWITNCVQPGRGCGASWLGDGRAMLEAKP